MATVAAVVVAAAVEDDVAGLVNVSVVLSMLLWSML